MFVGAECIDCNELVESQPKGIVGAQSIECSSSAVEDSAKKQQEPLGFEHRHLDLHT